MTAVALAITLGWQAGSVAAHSIDELAVAALMRREGLPVFIDVGGILYRPVFGSEAKAVRRRADKVPKTPAA